MKAVDLKVLSDDCNQYFFVSGESEHKTCSWIGLELPQVFCVDSQQQNLHFRCQKYQ